MFSYKYRQFEEEIRENISEFTEKPTNRTVERILQKGYYPISDITTLLFSSKHLEQIREFVNNKFRRDNNTLNHISPIYLSSICTESCGYCNYTKDEKIARKRLSLEEAEQEIKTVMSDGARVIEFTLSTDPWFTPERLVEYIAKAKQMLGNEKGSGVLLCSDYFEVGQYRLLKEAGLWGIVQWDETLDLKNYSRWHTKGKKSNFWKRMDTQDKAIQAGLNVGTGFLFGLSDFKYDVLMQIKKARYLRKEYGVQPFVFGTPRIQGTIPDKDYELALMAYKLAEPTIPRWLQTRETPELNLRNILDGDIYTYNCGEVKPGGYSLNKNGVDGQFEVNEMTKKQFEKELKERIFQMDYAWLK